MSKPISRYLIALLLPYLPAEGGQARPSQEPAGPVRFRVTPR
jgi:hypothetical protein